MITNCIRNAVILAPVPPGLEARIRGALRQAQQPDSVNEEAEVPEAERAPGNIH